MTGAGAAWAKEIVLPEKNPAVTLTIPDDWKTEVRDTEVVSTSPDGDVSFEVGFETRADRDSLVKDKVSFLRKQKVNLSIKPVEQAMDFGGTPARVQRYRTTDKYGKTIVDLVTLDASRDRALLMTIWGSEDQRQANEAALDTIMKSVRVPAETGGSSNFWSGGKTAAKPETKPEPKVEMKSEPAAAGLSPSVAAAQPAPAKPYATRRALYVARKAADFGDVEARPSNVFKPGEPLLTYIEPVGEATQSIGSDQIGFGVIVDFEVRTAEGKALATQKSMIDRDVTVKRAEGEPNFFLNLSLDLDGFPPGNYVLVYTLRDKLSGRTLDVPQPIHDRPGCHRQGRGRKPGRPKPGSGGSCDAPRFGANHRRGRVDGPACPTGRRLLRHPLREQAPARRRQEIRHDRRLRLDPRQEPEAHNPGTQIFRLELDQGPRGQGHAPDGGILPVFRPELDRPRS
ncbi:hypothetical protein ACSD7O_23650 [Methylorubrum extorquens]|uniref:hypothetical protein n=1 Tax=Methylorubrum extorquens TaxID=408 RepID=UPI003F61657F